MVSEVVDNPALHRFELAIGDEIAVADYHIQGDDYLLYHTEVPDHLSGRGYGSKLARGVYEALRKRGKYAIPACSFMAVYAARHPEFAALVRR
jgi:predicted GNAT family acetyltransferase